MRVAIVGAGLCGLATSRAVARSCRGAAVTVFEARPDERGAARAALRRHGARILLSPGSEAALRRLDFDANADVRPLVYYDHAGSRPLYTVRPPSVDAAVLRRHLLSGADVRYGAAIDDLQLLRDSFDIVIGCDGRRSVVRRAADSVVAQAVRDCGLRRITLDVPLAAFGAAAHHDLAFVGQRSIATVARYGDRLRAALVSPLDRDDPDLGAAYRRITRDWLHPVRDLIDHIDDDSVIDCDAIQDRDRPRLRFAAMGATIALAGDALWSMAPYTGHAAGVALADAVAVADVLATDGADLSAYWRQVQDAPAPFVQEARAMLDFVHGDDVVAHLVEFGRRQAQRATQ